jgi:hypothetical protein
LADVDVIEKTVNAAIFLIDPNGQRNRVARIVSNLL